MRSIRFARSFAHLDVGHKEIEKAVEAAARITSSAIER
jgi:hypothetical protein